MTLKEELDILGIEVNKLKEEIFKEIKKLFKLIYHFFLSPILVFLLLFKHTYKD